MRLAVIAVAAALAAAPAFAQESAKTACAAMDAALPAELADWNGKAVLAPAANGAGIGGSAMTLGKG